MNIRFSRQSKRRQTFEPTPSQCRLFNYTLLSQTFVQRRKTFSRRKAKPQDRNNSRSGLKLLKNINQAQNISKNTSTQPSIKGKPIISSGPAKKIVVVHGHKTLQQKNQQTNLTSVKTNRIEFFHGSWGIPKYCKYSQPIKQITRISSSQFISTQPSVRDNSAKYQIQVQATPSNRTKNQQEVNSWRFSKYMNSTRTTKNEQVGWNQSVRLVQSFVMNPQVKSQPFLLDLPQASASKEKKQLQQISNLNDANTVFSQYSRHSRELSEGRLNKSLKGLNESLVIANDMNEDGFWN